MAATHDTRLEGLDALRGIAAVAVMLYHYTAWFGHGGIGHPAPGPSIVFTRGNFGVELFFIISGFVITMTLTRTDTLGAFAVSRLARLYPAFLACLVFTLVVTQAAGATPGGLVANLTMMPELFGAHMIDGSYWSLLYELVFYALAAFCVFGLGCRSPEIPCAAWLGVAVAIRLAGLDATINPLMQLTAASFAHLFVIGVMLSRLHARQGTWLTWVVLGVAVEIGFMGPFWTFVPITALGYGGMVMGLAALVWFAATPAGAVLAIGPMRMLGRVSYPLYLVHQAAGFTLIAWLEDAGLVPDLAIGATIILAVAVAWMVSTVVEWPARRWLRARLGPRPSPNPLAASAAG